ncbi:MAG: DnaJ domain-containing protein [Dehalococcoidia bacterium]
MSDRDYYEVLGLTPRADGVMVDQAYWHLARKYQALATTNERGRRLLDELNEAYGVLGNARLRKEYDAFRDDVLVAGGVIGAVPSNPKRKAARRKKAGTTEVPPARRVQMPTGWRVWAAATVLAAAGAGGAVATGRPEMGAIGVAVSLVVALAPELRRRASTLRMPSLSMPARAAVSIPSASLPAAASATMPAAKPNVNLSRVAEHLGRGSERDDAVDPDELHASTSAVIARWRKSMGLRTSLRDQASPGSEPSNALVEIVESERQIDERESEPLMAVIDILRGARRAAASKRPDRSSD